MDGFSLIFLSFLLLLSCFSNTLVFNVLGFHDVPGCIKVKLICGVFGLSEFACVAACDMKEGRKCEGERKNHKGEEKYGRSQREGEAGRVTGGVG